MVTGWLLPNGNFVECNKNEHIQFVTEHKEVLELVPKIAEVLHNLELQYEEQCEYSDRVGSTDAEWHHYEIACDDARREIWRLLLNNGFIRVGEYQYALHFEGRPNQLKKRHQACKDLADSYGADCMFEPIK